ncbi:MAG: AAA family ATPase [Bacteroidales bacterium]
MNILVQKSIKKIKTVTTAFKRYLYYKIDWKDRLIIIKGARGAGKTTLILQYIQETFGYSDKALYVSLDDIWFAENRLVHLAEEFVKMGGTHLFIDEVHKYPGWSREIKNMYDDHRELHLIITSSSALQILKGSSDLSRRSMIYNLNEISIREFIQLHYQISVPKLSLHEILSNHTQKAVEISEIIKPLRIFKEYLQWGCYPYSIENKDNYLQRLINTVLLTLETDMPAILNIDYGSVVKLKRLLYVITTSSPFKPNISELSQKIGVSRDTLLKYIHYLENAHLINLLQSGKKGMSYMAKPEKIYPGNPNIIFAVGEKQINTGTLRETFFFNQLSAFTKIYYTPDGDFNVNNEFVVEIGGKNKTNEQIKSLENAYLALDGIETGYKNKIPLWLFGFLY